MNKQASGLRGEDRAVRFLEAQGYQILERNYRHGRAEVDIIAVKQPWLVFVEVKTRSSHAFGYPEEFVNQKQAARIVQAAEHYMEQMQWEGSLRFDIIAITEGPQAGIQHFEDAFY